MVSKTITTQLSSSFYENQFTGLLMINAESKDTLYDTNSDKYFTPASNTKILTLYTALHSLPNHIPALSYRYQNDSLYFEGTGDPSFLHPHVQDSTAYHFLKNQKNLVYVTGNYQDFKFGPGWSWEDYDYYYAPERSGLPLYGNVVTISNTLTQPATPRIFKDSIVRMPSKKNRNLYKNIFYLSPLQKDTIEIPFTADDNTRTKLLAFALKKPVKQIAHMPIGDKQILHGIPADSLYKRLMHQSDNFIAEQLLALSSFVLFDTINTTKAINYSLEHILPELPQSPRWVDGSGLSRYNLLTPQTLVYVLNKLYAELPKERLYALFPAGGASGTLKSVYAGDKEPYIYAKSGSLSNNYCLSGYLLTKSGKTVIFSFMNNHYKQPSREIKNNMELILQLVRDKY